MLPTVTGLLQVRSPNNLGDAGGCLRCTIRSVGNGVAHHPEHETHLGAKLIATSERLGITHSKHRPRIAGGGENLPLEVLRSLSVWVSVLDERGVVPGAALGGMLGCIAAFEDSLSSERFCFVWSAVGGVRARRKGRERMLTRMYLYSAGEDLDDAVAFVCALSSMV